MEDFVRKAFDEAVKNTANDMGFRAYKEHVIKNMETIAQVAVLNTGVDDMLAVMDSLGKSGKTDTFVEFSKALVSLGFYIGYGAGRNGE
jgi:hypothetical protein